MLEIQGSITEALLVGGFLIVFIAAWRGFMRYASQTARWPELSKQFPAGSRPGTEVFEHQAGRINGVSYQGTLRLAPGPSGLFVEVDRLFAYKQSPLLIPWSAFRELREYRNVLGYRHYELVLSDEKVFFLWRRAGDAVGSYFQGPRPVGSGRTLFPLFTRPL